ncbi:MAG: 5-formyltetrahydrofolate cyclo-ligase [Pseudomonadota bacterium]
MQSEHRTQALAARRALSARQRQHHSAKILETLKLLPSISNARKLGFYFPMPDEVDVLPIQTNSHAENKTYFLPIMVEGTKLEFAPYENNAQMQTSKLGVQEPAHRASERLQANELDAVIVPLVAFDRHCNRIGMGAGYYDRSFSFRFATQTSQAPILVGVAFEAQRIESITSNTWDVPLDLVVTEKRLYQRV